MEQGVLRGASFSKLEDRAINETWATLFADRDQLLSGRFYQDYIEAVQTGIAEKEYQLFTRTADGLDAALQRKLKGSMGSFYLLSTTTIPRLHKMLKKAYDYEVFREMALTAIALQRYRRREWSFLLHCKILCLTSCLSYRLTG